MKKFSFKDIQKELNIGEKKKEVSDKDRHAQYKITRKWLDEKKFMPKNHAIKNAVIKFLSETKLGIREKGLFLVGGVGTGKTMAFKIIQTVRNFDFYQAYQITEDSKNSEDTQLFIKELFIKYYGEKKKNVIIDDLGDELTINNYGIKSEFMVEAIRERHQSFLSCGDLTLISTNLGREELNDRYGERIVSRIEQMCESVVCNGDDLRKDS